MLSKRVALGLAGVVAAGVIGTAGVAAATAPAGTPAPAATASAAPGAPADGEGRDRHGRARALAARGLHGEWVVKGKDDKPVTLVSVRGRVTAVSGTSVTVKAEDGFTATFVATADTRVRGADVDSMADVTVGATGAVVGVKTGDTLTARTVLVRK